jgi:hypothetical protein
MQLARYDTGHPPAHSVGEARLRPSQPLRIESADEAAAIDERILDAWASHPRRIIIPAERRTSWRRPATRST